MSITDRSCLHRLIPEIIMSFILDALKKSEREREQQAQGLQPGFVYRRPHTPPVWMIAVIGLLLVNMVLIVVMWMPSLSPPAIIGMRE